MGNTDSTEQGFDKLEQRRPTRPQLDETIFQATSSQTPQNVLATQTRLNSQGSQQYLAAYHQPFIQAQPYHQSSYVPPQQPTPQIYMQTQSQPQNLTQQIQQQMSEQQSIYEGQALKHKLYPQHSTLPLTLQAQEWRVGMQHPHMLKTLGGQPEGDQIRYYFEFCPVTLKGLLADRVGTKKHFPEDDLQAMLLGIASSISFLQEQGLSHGNIVDNEIYFDSSSSSFKVIDSSLINGRGAGIMATLYNRQSPNLSPELYQIISINQPQAVIQQLTTVPEEHFCKNDVWGLGMIMLQSCLLLQNNNDLYMGNGHFRYDLLQQKIKQIRQIYSNQLTYAISLLVSPVDSRPDPVTLFPYLAQLFSQQQQIAPPVTQPPQSPYLKENLYYLPQYQQSQQMQNISNQRLVSPPQRLSHQNQKKPIPQNGAPKLAPSVPVRQVVKQIHFPDGRVEYQVTQPDDQTAPRSEQPVPMVKLINYSQHQISQQSENGCNVLGNIENRMQFNDPQEDRIQKVIAQSQALRENFA